MMQSIFSNHKELSPFSSTLRAATTSGESCSCLFHLNGPTGNCRGEVVGSKVRNNETATIPLLAVPDMVNKKERCLSGKRECARAASSCETFRQRLFCAQSGGWKGLLALCRTNRRRIGFIFAGAVLVVGMSILSAQLVARNLLSSGFDRLSQKQYHEAERLFEAAILLDSNNADAFVGRGFCQIEKHDSSAALCSFERALSICPDHAGALRKRADTKSALRQYDADLGKARRLLGRGDAAGALEVCNRLAAVKDVCLKPEFFLLRSQVYRLQHKFPLALDELELARQNDQGNADYLLGEANCYAELKEFDQAIRLCNRCLTQNPRSLDAWLQHAKYSYAVGNKLTAMKDIEKSLQLDPKSIEAYVLRADYFQNAGQYDKAADALQHVVALESGSQRYKARLSNCLARVQVASRAPRNVVDSGSVLARAGRTLDVSKVPNRDFASLLRLGYMALQRGDSVFSACLLVQAVKQRPNDWRAREYLMYALANSADPEAALEQYYALERLGRANLEVALNLSGQLKAGGNTELVEKVLAHVCTRYSKDPQSLLAIGRKSFSLQNFTMASAACELGIASTKCDAERKQLSCLLAAIDQAEQRATAPLTASSATE